MTPTASLPMYNLPEMRAANARFWEALRGPLVEAGLRDVPESLTFDRLPVSLDQRGELRYGGRVHSGAAASAWWAEQAKIRRAGLELLPPGPSGGDELPTVVILRADRDASYGTVRRTLAAAQEQGFAKFSLVVLRRE